MIFGIISISIGVVGEELNARIASGLDSLVNIWGMTFLIVTVWNMFMKSIEKYKVIIKSVCLRCGGQGRKHGIFV